jgi:Uma2 family endonuclease
LGAYTLLVRDSAHHRYTWAEYVALERASTHRNEFYNGEIYAMAGGTPQHARLAARAIGQLHQQLSGKKCEPYTSDLRVRVVATGLATYPDVTVVCGPIEADPQDPNTAINPTVLIEVLSSSTEDYDRGQKFEHFRQIPSLRECVLVSHREQLLEVFRRSDESWARSEARPGAMLELRSIACRLSVAALYEGVGLHPG